MAAPPTWTRPMAGTSVPANQNQPVKKNGNLRANKTAIADRPATNAGYRDYEEQYQSMLRHLDPNSSTERAFITFLYENSLRLPDEAQKRVEGIYCQPDFYYEPRFCVFCDGSPHDEEAIRQRDEE